MSEQDVTQDEESQTIDFAAACTAALGVPSPSLSRGLSFEDVLVPPVIPPAGEQKRRGDIEEEEELKRILDLSKSEEPDKIDPHVTSPLSEASVKVESSELTVPEVESTSDAAEMSGEFPVVEMKNENNDLSEDLILKTAMPQTKDLLESASDGVENSEEVTFPRLLPENISLDVNQCMAGSTGEQSAGRTGEEHDSVGTVPAEVRDSFLNGAGSVESEPIYQGEEHILNSRSMVYESPEPVYEGEVLLAENASKGASPHESGDGPEDCQCKCLFIAKSVGILNHVSFKWSD
jgi:ubiquitin carboxyl-terminal hydrolase MINDY-1/2